MTKKLLSLLLAVLMTVSLFPLSMISVFADDSGNAEQTGSNVSQTYDGYTPLVNTLYKLENGGNLKVGYIGDSISYGQTANYNSDSEFIDYASRNANNYQANPMVFTRVFTDWLAWYAEDKLNVDDVDIDPYYSSIGGATIAQALSYVDENICAYTPDLVVIEIYNSITNSEVWMESVLQHIYASNPYCDVIVFSTDGQCSTWGDLLEHYGIPFIDGITPLRTYFSRTDIFGSDASFNNNKGYYFGNGYPHTQEEGYAFYTKVLTEGVEKLFDTARLSSDHGTYSPAQPDSKIITMNGEEVVYPTDTYSDDQLYYYADNLYFEDFTLSSESDWKQTGAAKDSSEPTPDQVQTSRYITAQSNGAYVTFSFVGTTMRVYSPNGNGSYAIYEIDGEGNETLVGDNSALTWQSSYYTLSTTDQMHQIKIVAQSGCVLDFVQVYGTTYSPVEKVTSNELHSVNYYGRIADENLHDETLNGYNVLPKYLTYILFKRTETYNSTAAAFAGTILHSDVTNSDNFIGWIEADDIVFYEGEKYPIVYPYTYTAGDNYVVGPNGTQKTLYTSGSTINLTGDLDLVAAYSNAPSYTVSITGQSYSLSTTDVFVFPEIENESTENKIVTFTDSNGNVYTAGDVVCVSADTAFTLVADDIHTVTVKNGNQIIAETKVGSTYTLPAAPTAAENKIFSGWTDGVNTYDAGASVNVTEDVTFFAVWKNSTVLHETAQKSWWTSDTHTATLQSTTDPVTVEFGIQIGSSTSCSILKINDVDVVKIDASRGALVGTETTAGLTFDQWSTSVITVNITDLSTGAATVNIVSKNSTYTTTMTLGAIGSTITLTADKKANQSYDKISQVVEENVTIYTVSFTMGCSESEVASIPSIKTVGEVTLPTPEERTGYAFNGWNDGSTTYDAGTTVTVSANTTFTAVWVSTSTSYTVTFKDAVSDTVFCTKEIDLDSPSVYMGNYASEKGKILSGWSDGTTTYALSRNVNISGNTTFYAVWGSTLDNYNSNDGYKTLTNTLYKLENGGNLKVGIIGDSISWGQIPGSGSNIEDVSYASKFKTGTKNPMAFPRIFSDWLDDYFTNTLNIQDLNTEYYYSTWGGANLKTMLGYLNEDILAYTPDLVIIEVYNIMERDGVNTIWLESMIQQIYAVNPNCDIIMLNAGGELSLVEHKKIYEHYGIPVICTDSAIQQWFGNAVTFGDSVAFHANYSIADDGSVKGTRGYYYANGYPHLTEEGYQYMGYIFGECFATLVAAAKADDGYGEYTPVVPEAKRITYNSESGTYVMPTDTVVEDPSDLYLFSADITPDEMNAGSDWTVLGTAPDRTRPQDSQDRANSYRLVASTEGASLTLSFNGSAFMLRGSGTFTYSVDGGDAQTLTATTLVTLSEEDADHTITICASSASAEINEIYEYSHTYAPVTAYTNVEARYHVAYYAKIADEYIHNGTRNGNPILPVYLTYLNVQRTETFGTQTSTAPTSSVLPSSIETKGNFVGWMKADKVEWINGEKVPTLNAFRWVYDSNDNITGATQVSDGSTKTLYKAGDTIPAGSDLDLVAVFVESASGYSVTFKDASGSVISDATINCLNGKVTLPDITSLTDSSYKLIGWTIDGTHTYEIGDTVTISGDTVFTPVRKEIVKHTITFKDNGETLTSISGSYSETFTLPSALTKDDHTFSGWSDGNDTYAAGATVTVSADTTFTAVWVSGSGNYTVVFKDGNKIIQTLAGKTEDDTITVPYALAKSGYVFKGYSDGTSTFAAGSTINITGNTTLTAVWSTIAEAAPVEMNVSSDIITTANGALEGFNTVSYDETSGVCTGIVNNRYTYTLSRNVAFGGKTVVALENTAWSLSGWQNSVIILNATNINKTVADAKYVTLNYYYAPSGNNNLVGKHMVLRFTAGTTVYYAYSTETIVKDGWSTLTFNFADNAKKGTANSAAAYDISAIGTQTISKAELFWYETDTQTGASGTIKAAVGDKLYLSDMSFAKTAQAGNYNVTFMSGSDKYAVSETNGSVKLPALPAGYQKWNDGTNQYNAGAVVTVSGDKTFTVSTAASEYQVRFYNGTSLVSGPVTTMGSVTLPNALTPDNDYAIFGGWSDGTTTYPAGSTVNVTGDTDFTAVWKEKVVLHETASGYWWHKSTYPITLTNTTGELTVEFYMQIASNGASTILKINDVDVVKIDASQGGFVGTETTAGLTFDKWSISVITVTITDLSTGAATVNIVSKNSTYNTTMTLGAIGSTLTLSGDSSLGATNAYDKVTQLIDLRPRYTVTFVNEGGTAIPSQTTLGEVTLPTPEDRDGYAFKGWNDGSSTFNAGATVNVSADTTFTALWEKVDTYQITFTYGSSTSVKTWTAEREYTLPSDTFTREGFTLKGWKNSLGKYFAVGAAVTPTKNETYTAVWALNYNGSQNLTVNGSYATVDTEGNGGLMINASVTMPTGINFTEFGLVFIQSAGLSDENDLLISGIYNFTEEKVARNLSANVAKATKYTEQDGSYDFSLFITDFWYQYLIQTNISVRVYAKATIDGVETIYYGSIAEVNYFNKALEAYNDTDSDLTQEQKETLYMSALNFGDLIDFNWIDQSQTKPVGDNYPAISSSATTSYKQLSNLLYKIQNNEDICIGYLGGSITYGVTTALPDGSKDTTLTYVNQVTDWLSDYAEEIGSTSTVTKVNAGISGTTSIFGLARLHKDLFLNDTVTPDLVFIEYSSNDWLDYATGDLLDQVTRFESIIKEIYKYNPKADIIMLSTNRYGLDTPNQPNMVTYIMQVVAKYYNLAFINVGTASYGLGMKDTYTAIKNGLTYAQFYSTVATDANGLTAVTEEAYNDLAAMYAEAQEMISVKEAGNSITSTTTYAQYTAMVTGTSVITTESRFNTVRDICVPVGFNIDTAMRNRGIAWSQSDWLHPTSLGYTIYTNIITDHINTLFTEASTPTELVNVPAPNGIYGNDAQFGVNELHHVTESGFIKNATGWTTKTNGIYSWADANTALVSSTVGATFEFDFTGTGFAFVEQIAHKNDPVVLEYSLDNGTTWSEITLADGNQPQMYMCENGLDYGTYHVKVRYKSGNATVTLTSVYVFAKGIKTDTTERSYDTFSMRYDVVFDDSSLYYTITYHYSSASDAQTSAVRITKGSIIEGLMACPWTRDGYEFDGWIDMSTGLLITNETFKLEEDLDLLANWKEVKPKIKGHSVSFQNNLNLNYYVDASSVEGLENLRLLIEMDVYDAEGTLTTRTDTLYGTLTENGYKFVFKGIAASEAGNEIRAKVCGEKNGTTYYSDVDTYSMKTYAYNRLENSTDTTFKTMIVDMLNYCSAAQTYFGIRTNALVNADLTAEQQALGTTTVPTTSNNGSKTTLDGATATIYGKSVVFNSNIEMKFYVRLDETVDTDNVKLKVVVNETTEYIGFEEFTDIGNSQYVVKYTDISAAELRELVSVTVVDGDNVISGTITYSIETYVYNRLNNSTETDFKALLTELMKYGDSAYAYFNK